MAEHTEIRPEAHETDTVARRIVPLQLPHAWEHREPGGRDYGVDMQIELFRAGRATGQVLLLQIKGTAQAIDESEDFLPFDLSVSTLKYSELFSVPFLLVVCPINAQPHRWYFVWPQEYIDAVLNFENPNWRENKSTVRVKIPIGNRIPGRHEHLEGISGDPIRIKSFGRLAHLTHELEWALVDLHISVDQLASRSADFQRARELLAELKQLRGLTVDLAAGYSGLQGKLHPLDVVVNLLEGGKPITQADLQGVCNFDEEAMNAIEHYHADDPEHLPWLMKTLATQLVSATIGSLQALLSSYFDVRLRHLQWKSFGIHRF